MRTQIMTVSSIAELLDKKIDLAIAVVSLGIKDSLAPFSLTNEETQRLIREAKRVSFDFYVGETFSFLTEKGWIGLVGARNASELDYRKIGTAVINLCQKQKAKHVAIFKEYSAIKIQHLTEGIALSDYTFDAHKTRKQTIYPEKLYILIRNTQSVHRGKQLASAVLAARDLANEHPGKCTPRYIAEKCQGVAEKYNFDCEIWTEKRLEKAGFNLLLAVGRGSVEPSYLIHMTYIGAGVTKKTLAYVGKGVTYDSGGYSLKIGSSLLNMHLDMGGAAAVFGAAIAIGKTKPRNVKVHFIIPVVENLISARAFKMNEIIRSLDNTSVEIQNTDAEGRLILADAITYANRLKPDEIIDLATLTGSCMNALGLEIAGVFSNNDKLATSFLESARITDEQMWQLPMSKRLKSSLNSSAADIRNIGSSYGGAIVAAFFLQHFAKKTPWLHIDIAGPAMTESSWEYINRGGTGFGVLALHHYASKNEISV